MKAGVGLLEQETPKNYKSAITGKGAQQWSASMDREIQSCLDNKTWTMVKRTDLPSDANVLPSMFVYKTKINSEGLSSEQKSRLVPKGYYQVKGHDVGETYASTGMYKTMRVGLSLAASLDLEIEQLDVPSAFLNADLEETVYMELPQGYTRDGYVVRLHKSLYGLRQAPRNWYLKCSSFIKSLGFTAAISDPCFFFKRSATGKLIYIFLFVDDMQGFFDKSDHTEWIAIKQKLVHEYNVKDLGETKLFLGMKITRDRVNHTISLDQELYIVKMLERFGLSQCKPCSTPEVSGDYSTIGNSTDGGDSPTDLKEYQALVGSLLYAALSTRLDISHCVRNLTSWMLNPTHRHLIAAQRVLRYLSGTRTHALTFGAASLASHTAHVPITAFADADWAGCKVSRKSVSGFVTKLNGDVVTWASKKQSVVAQSSCEAELYAESAAIQEVMWLNGLMAELGFDQSTHSVIYGDNQSTQTISKNGIKSDRTKHIDVKYHFITDCINKNQIKLEWVPSVDNQADIFTKALDRTKFTHFTDLLMNK